MVGRSPKEDGASPISRLYRLRAFLAYSSQEVSMKRSQYSESQIVGILRKANSGVTVKEMCRKYEIGERTCYTWNSVPLRDPHGS
jgi:hypothetical protein